MHNLSTLIQDFLTNLELRNKSPKTLENYTHYLRRFQEFIESRSEDQPKPQDITLQTVQDYRIYLNRFLDDRKRPLSIKTQNYHVISLRAFLKYLAKNDIDTLAAEKIELAKIPQRTVEFLSREEVDRLFAAANSPRDRAILETLYSTGLRVSELHNLNRQQVDLDRREFSVRGKGQKARIVFLSDRAAQTIKTYLSTRDDNFDPLFINSGRGMKQDITNPDVRRLSTVSIEALVRKCARKAGIIKKVTPHTLRHSYATNLLQNGADIRSVQEMLGHSSITTTQIYTHVTDKALREIHKKFHN